VLLLLTIIIAISFAKGSKDPDVAKNDFVTFYTFYIYSFRAISTLTSFDVFNQTGNGL